MSFVSGVSIAGPLRRTLLLGVATVLAVAAVLTAAPRAHAADYVEKCNSGAAGNQRDIDLPNKTDLDVHVWLCVYKNGSKTYGRIYVAWDPASSPTFGSGHKFDSFQVIVNLERRVNGDDVDKVVNQNTCDITGTINGSWNSSLYCQSDLATYDSAYNWSADGYLRYDVDNDGEGVKPLWFLTGSPLLY